MNVSVLRNKNSIFAPVALLNGSWIEIQLSTVRVVETCRMLPGIINQQNF